MTSPGLYSYLSWGRMNLPRIWNNHSLHIAEFLRTSPGTRFQWAFRYILTPSVPTKVFGSQRICGDGVSGQIWNKAECRRT